MNQTLFYEYGKSRGKDPNTFIGNVGNTITSPSLLASRIGIAQNRITSFSIIDSNLQCNISGSYTLPVQAFTYFSSPIGVVTYYRDMDGLITSIGSQCFYGGNLTEGFFPNLTNLGPNAFDGNIGGSLNLLRFLYIPRVLTLGTSVANDSIFRGQQNFGGILYINPVQLTIQGGAPDSDLQLLINGNWDIRYVSDFTNPNAVTDLSVSDIVQSGAFLNFSTPDITNVIDYYETYADGVLRNKTTNPNSFINNLNPSTFYKVNIIAVDIYYNKSEVSNNVLFTTLATSGKRLHEQTWYNPLDIQFYLKLDFDTVDYNSKYTGVPTNIKFNAPGAFPFVSASFNGVSSKITLPNAATYNDTQTIVFWAKLNTSVGTFYSKGSDSSGGWGVLLQHVNDRVEVNVVTLNPAAGYWHSIPDIKADFQWFHFAFVYNNTTDIISEYVDGIKIGQKQIAGSLFRGNNDVILGVRHTSATFIQYLNGGMADFAVIKRVLTDTEILSLQ